MSLLLLLQGEEAPPSTEDVQQHLLLALMWPHSEGGEPSVFEPPPGEGHGSIVGMMRDNEWEREEYAKRKRRQLKEDDEALLAFVQVFVETHDA
jgi:hypothetical protein